MSSKASKQYSHPEGKDKRSERDLELVRKKRDGMERGIPPFQMRANDQEKFLMSLPGV